MLGLNCLIKDTRAVQDIKNAISILVGDRLQKGDSVQFPSVYKELRDAGLEIDAESAGALYNELFSKFDAKELSNEEQILEFTGKDVTLEQKALVDAIEGVPSENEKQLGKLSPEKQVALNIAKMFRDAQFEGTKNVQSVMKKMESLVTKAANSLLPPGKQKERKTIHDSLQNFFNTESVQFQRLDGGINTLETLHKAVKKEVDNYVNEVSSSLSDEQAEVLKSQWDEYVNGFMNSAYDIMLGKSDQSKLLNEALKQVKIDGQQIVDVNGNIKWNKLMEDGNPATIGESVAKLFRDGIKDENGVEQKYSSAQADRIGEYVKGLYEKKIGAVKQQKIGNERSKNISSKNIISDFIKDKGFINLVKDKDGKLLLTQANWAKALEKIRESIGVKKGVDPILTELDKYLKGLTNEKGERRLTDQQVDIVKREFEQTVAAKLVPGTATPHAMDRLIALKNLNGGKAFNEQTQSALNHIVGVSGLDEKVINQIKELTQAAQDIISGNNVSESTSDDPLKNRGAYAYQALSQVERKIKEIIRSNKMSRSQTQSVVKYISDVLGAASTSLLINPGNFGENIVTGIASNVGETVNMLTTNPKLFKRLSESQSDFWKGWASHASGGVANEVINETDMTSDLQAGERLRVRGLMNDFNNGKYLSALAKAPGYVVSLVSRWIMNSFDAGFNSSMLRKKAVTSIYSALRDQGYTSKETLDLMDSALKVDEATNKELDAENERIKKILNDAGLNPTAADMAQNKIDMKLSLYERVIQAGARGKDINATPKQIREITKALVESSAIQAKVLGGKKQIPISSADVLNKAIYGASLVALYPQREAFKTQQKLEEQGKLRQAAYNQAFAEGWKNTIGRFAGGIANFLALATTATPYGYVTALSLKNQEKSLLRDKTDAADIYKAEPGEIRKYAEYHNLIRSMVVRATLGSTAIAAFIAHALSDDDDDDESFVSNLMQTKSGRRLLQKYMPLGMNIAMSTLYDVEDDKKLDTAMERLMEVVGAVTNRQYDSWGTLKTEISRAKNDEEIQTAFARILGGAFPTFNLNQGEQIDKFTTVLESAFDAGKIEDVKEQEERAKQVYKDIDNALDAFLVNGGIDAIRRTLSEDKSYNRVKKD